MKISIDNKKGYQKLPGSAVLVLLLKTAEILDTLGMQTDEIIEVVTIRPGDWKDSVVFKIVMVEPRSGDGERTKFEQEFQISYEDVNALSNELKDRILKHIQIGIMHQRDSLQQREEYFYKALQSLGKMSGCLPCEKCQGETAFFKDEKTRRCLKCGLYQ